MFWKRKNSQEEILAKLEEFLCAGREMMEDNRRKQEEEWMRQRRELQSWSESVPCSLKTEEKCPTDDGGVLDEIRKKLPEWEKTLRRQTDSIEDFLDICDERREQESLLEQELREERKREEALVNLVCFCREQMDLIAKNLGKDLAWAEQNRMIEQEAQKYLRAAQIRETGVCGETVDYEFHQVLNTVETSQKELDGTVAEVYRRGRIWRGKVVRKAQVAAYRLEREKRE